MFEGCLIQRVRLSPEEQVVCRARVGVGGFSANPRTHMRLEPMISMPDLCFAGEALCVSMPLDMISIMESRADPKLVFPRLYLLSSPQQS